MEINRTNPEIQPPFATDEAGSARAEPGASQPVAPDQPIVKAALKANDELPINFSRADLHSVQQAEIIHDSLLALLDRASDTIGPLPTSTRQQALDCMANDPFMASRLLNYLGQKAN